MKDEGFGGRQSNLNSWAQAGVDLVGDSSVQDTEREVVSEKSVCGLRTQGADTLKETRAGQPQGAS